MSSNLFKNSYPQTIHLQIMHTIPAGHHKIDAAIQMDKYKNV